MSSLLLRLGLWTILLVLGLYVLGETMEDNPTRELLSAATLRYIALGGFGLIVGGAVLGMLERAADKVRHSSCKVCRRTIPKGELYCRQHLRGIMEEEFEKTRRERIRK